MDMGRSVAIAIGIGFLAVLINALAGPGAAIDFLGSREPFASKWVRESQ